VIAQSRYTIGVDFGTESGRAVLVDVAVGREVGIEVEPYRNGVIDARLPAPDEDVILGPDWALQDPEDYVQTFRGAVRRLVDGSGIDPSHVIGIGIDFTACTMLPTTRDGIPLCFLDEFRRNPHAWVKLWKHHAAQPEADDINRVARELDQPWLKRYGGKISSEWFFPKALQILREAPEVYRAADRLLEAADWVVWQLTGRETRNNCTAGYKALWSAEEGFPEPRFFEALEPGFGTVVDDKLSRTVVPIGGRAGALGEQAAGWTGLLSGTAVAIANVDAHVSVPAATVTEPGTLVAIMGTSICHVVLADSAPEIDGMCGVVDNGVVPGYFGYEAGQAAVGDLFAWFVDEAVPSRYHDLAQDRGVSLHEVLADEAAGLRPGESGLLALDWWNGNRSVLVDADLSGVLVGMTLATTAPEIYRALIESTAFGTRVIIDAFEDGGVAVEQVVACGGLPDRNPLLMQIYADVTGRSWRVAASAQTPALGSAMFASVAAGADAGGHATIEDAARAMAHLRAETYRPNPSNRRVYDALYAEYVRLHDLFGRGGDPALKTLKRLRLEAIDGSAVADAASR
jgi:L-ribulokinase